MSEIFNEINGGVGSGGQSSQILPFEFTVSSPSNTFIITHNKNATPSNVMYEETGNAGVYFVQPVWQRVNANSITITYPSMVTNINKFILFF